MTGEARWEMAQPSNVSASASVTTCSRCWKRSSAPFARQDHDPPSGVALC